MCMGVTHSAYMYVIVSSGEIQPEIVVNHVDTNLSIQNMKHLGDMTLGSTVLCSRVVG